MSKSIEILCAVTCTYENKKLAIICPVGKIIENVENFNPEYLAKRFSGDINKAYPVEVLVEVEQMIAPIVNRFGKIPDVSYATIAGIRDADNGEDMPRFKAKIDELYTLEKDLFDKGYNTYGVFYVEHNIEKFTDETDIPFSEDRTLMKANCENYDLNGLINTIRDAYIDTVSSSSIPSLFNECFIASDYYSIIGKDKSLTIDDINNFFINVEEASIYLPFAIEKSKDKVNLATGEEVELNSINVGEIKFNEKNEYGISIDLIDSKYIFNLVEYIFDENNKNYSISILEDGGDLTSKVLDLIEKFN